MKKIFNLFVVACISLSLVGCGNKILNLEKVSENLTNLTSDNFDILTAVENIELKYFSEQELENVYDYDLEKLGIDNNNIEQMAFRIDSNKNPVYIIVKPQEGKMDIVKKEFNDYFKTLSLNDKLEEEYQDCLIYVFSDKKEEVLKTIKDSKSPIFGMLMDVGNADLEALTGINPNDLEEFLVKNSVITQANSYFILKPKKDKYDVVKKALDDYMTNVENQWATYLPDQYELVKNRLEEEYGDYLIYIISIDNELVLKTIKDSK